MDKEKKTERELGRTQAGGSREQETGEVERRQREIEVPPGFPVGYLDRFIRRRLWKLGGLCG
jgi:hypothetical protein